MGVSFGGSSAAAADLAPLIASLQSDSSFKVRLQAARILVRHVEVTQEPPTREMLDAFARAAAEDAHPVVRAFAVRSLGELGGAEHGAVLNAALADSDPFVREQAEAARIRWSARLASAPLLVLTVDAWRLEDDQDRTDELLASLRRQAEALSSGRFRIAPPEDGRGFWLRATVSDLASRAEADRERVTLELKLALATWPEKNLRNVITARASARVPSTYPNRDRLHARLLDDAMKRAVSDALVELEGG